MTPDALMAAWLERQLPPEAADWLLTARERLRVGVSERDFNLAISLAPRRLGKADLVLGRDDLAAADAARRGWDPRGWTVDQAGRLVLTALAAWIGVALALLRRRRPGDIPRAVVSLIAGIALLDAMFLSVAGWQAAVPLALGCFAATLALQRWISGT